MGLRDEIARDILQIQSDLGGGNDAQATFTWAGTEIPCAATTELFGVTVSLDGNPTEATLGLLIRAADCPGGVPPVSGNKVTWNGKTYLVGRVRDLHGGGAWLYCTDWSSGGRRS